MIKESNVFALKCCEQCENIYDRCCLCTLNEIKCRKCERKEYLFKLGKKIIKKK